MGEDEALDRLKKELAESHLKLAWVDVWSKYQASVEAEDDEVRAQMALDEEEDEDSKEAEGANQEDPVVDSSAMYQSRPPNLMSW